MKSYLTFSLGSNLAGNLCKKCDHSSSIDCQWPALNKWNVRIISWVYHRSSLTCSSRAIFTAWLVPVSITSDFLVLLISHCWWASCYLIFRSLLMYSSALSMCFGLEFWMNFTENRQHIKQHNNIDRHWLFHWCKKVRSKYGPLRGTISYFRLRRVTTTTRNKLSSIRQLAPHPRQSCSAYAVRL